MNPAGPQIQDRVTEHPHHGLIPPVLSCTTCPVSVPRRTDRSGMPGLPIGRYNWTRYRLGSTRNDERASLPRLGSWPIVHFPESKTIAETAFVEKSAQIGTIQPRVIQ